MTLSDHITVIAMVNGMIGGTILVLPILALAAGSAFSIIVLTITGFFSFYSCYLCVIHLGDDKDLDYAILKHFSGSRAIKIFYDFVVFLNLFLILILYFQLIVEQWQGLTSSKSIAIPICNAIGLFFLVFVLKYFQFGASILAYGIISIIAYIIFLTWLLASAPSGTNSMPSFGKGSVGMAAAMGGAYSIQTFFIPVLKKSRDPKNYAILTLFAYCIGFAAYTYIAYAGSFGILNRKIPPGNTISTVEDYFTSGNWEVTCLQTLYLVHLYSASPQFLLVSKKRIFSAFKLKETQKGQIPIPQIIYTAIFIIICFIISVVDVPITAIIQFNGAVIGFFFIYFIPAALHVKCMYFCENQKQKKQLKQNDDNEEIKKRVTVIQIGPRQQSIQYRPTTPIKFIQKQQEDPINQTLIQRKSQGEILTITQQAKRKQLQETISNSKQFTCTYRRKGIFSQIIELIFALIMFLIGIFILVNGLITLANGSYKN